MAGHGERPVPDDGPGRFFAKGRTRRAAPGEVRERRDRLSRREQVEEDSRAEGPTSEGPVDAERRAQVPGTGRRR